MRHREGKAGAGLVIFVLAAHSGKATGHPIGVWGTAERSLSGNTCALGRGKGAFSPKEALVMWKSPGQAALSFPTQLPEYEISFQIPPPSGPREEEEGIGQARRHPKEREIKDKVHDLEHFTWSLP